MTHHGRAFSLKEWRKPEDLGPKVKVYIAGPMRGYPDLNFPAFYRAERLAKERGYAVVNPARMDAEYELSTGEPSPPVPPKENIPFYVERDIAELLKCQAIALLPGWSRSRGALAEWAVARWLELDVLDALTMHPLGNWELYDQIEYGLYMSLSRDAKVEQREQEAAVV